MTDVTSLLENIEAGDPEAYNALIPVIYKNLRSIAQQRMNNERADHTMCATDLVNEAFLRLVQVPMEHRWQNSVHFFSAAAEAMRRVLIDHARKRNSLKRGGEQNRVEADVDQLMRADSGVEFDSEDLLVLDEAITAFEQVDEECAQVIKLRFFAGLKRDQVAEQLGISARTVTSRWNYARAWLRRYISKKNQVD